MKLSIILLALVALSYCKKEMGNGTENSVIKDTAVKINNSNPAGKREDTQDKPAKSNIATTLDTKLLYNIWELNPDGPAADFKISAKSFYLADYDGDADRPYTLKGNVLTVYYENYTETGEITRLTKDTLKIKWKEIDTEMTYVLFPE